MFWNLLNISLIKFEVYYKIEQRKTKGNRDEQKSKLKTNGMRRISLFFLLLKSKQMV